MTALVPNNCGKDLFNKGKTLNAHVRVEKVAGYKPGRLTVTLFDNTVVEGDSFIDAQEFPNTKDGARELTDYLRDQGINVIVKPGRMGAACEKVGRVASVTLVIRP